MRTLYRILGVEMDATSAEIKKQYRKHARENHPDLAAAKGWSETETARRKEVFSSVAAAYAALSDPEKRARYDRDLNAIRWAFMAASRGAQRPRQRAQRADAPPFEGIDVEDLTAAVARRTDHKRRLRIEASRQRYEDKRAAFHAAVEAATQQILGEILLAQMEELGL